MASPQPKNSLEELEILTQEKTNIAAWIYAQQWDFRQGAAKIKQPECIYDT